MRTSFFCRRSEKECRNLFRLKEGKRRHRQYSRIILSCQGLFFGTESRASGDLSFRRCPADPATLANWRRFVEFTLDKIAVFCYYDFDGDDRRNYPRRKEFKMSTISINLSGLIHFAIKEAVAARSGSTFAHKVQTTPRTYGRRSGDFSIVDFTVEEARELLAIVEKIAVDSSVDFYIRGACDKLAKEVRRTNPAL